MLEDWPTGHTILTTKSKELKESNDSIGAYIPRKVRKRTGADTVDNREDNWLRYLMEILTTSAPYQLPHCTWWISRNDLQLLFSVSWILRISMRMDQDRFWRTWKTTFLYFKLQLKHPKALDNINHKCVIDPYTTPFLYLAYSISSFQYMFASQ